MSVHGKKCKSRVLHETLDKVCAAFMHDAKAACPHGVFPPMPWAAAIDEAAMAGPSMREFQSGGVSAEYLERKGFSTDAIVERSKEKYTIISMDADKLTVCLRPMNCSDETVRKEVTTSELSDTFTLCVDVPPTWIRADEMGNCLESAAVIDCCLKSAAQLALADAFTRSSAKVDIQKMGNKFSVVAARTYTTAAPLTLVPFSVKVERNVMAKIPSGAVAMTPKRGKKFVYALPQKFDDAAIVPFWLVSTTPDSAKANMVADELEVKAKGFGDDDIVHIPVMVSTGQVKKGAVLLIHGEAKDGFKKPDDDDDDDESEDSSEHVGEKRKAKGTSKGGKGGRKGKGSSAAKKKHRAS